MYDRPVEDLTRVLDAFAKFKGGPLCHTFGNHEVSAIARDKLLPMMQIPPAAATAAATGGSTSTHPAPQEQGAGYYDVLLHDGVRLVALDTYDAAMAGT